MSDEGKRDDDDRDDEFTAFMRLGVMILIITILIGAIFMFWEVLF